MIEFDEYKVRLNTLRPRLDELKQSLNIDACNEELERLHMQSESPGFWDDQERSQQVMKKTRSLESKVERYEKMCSQ